MHEATIMHRYMDRLWDCEWFALRIRVLRCLMFLPLGRCLHSFRSAAGSCQESTETAPAKDSAEGILEGASLQRCDFWAKDDASFLDFFSLLVIGCRPLEGSQQFSLGIGFGGAVEPESPGMNRSNTTVSFASFKRRRRSSIHFTWLWNWGIMRCLDARYVCWHPLFSHKLHLKTNPSAKVVELIQARWAFISHKGGK